MSRLSLEDYLPPISTIINLVSGEHVVNVSLEDYLPPISTIINLVPGEHVVNVSFDDLSINCPLKYTLATSGSKASIRFFGRIEA